MRSLTKGGCVVVTEWQLDLDAGLERFDAPAGPTTASSRRSSTRYLPDDDARWAEPDEAPPFAAGVAWPDWDPADDGASEP